MKRKRVGIQCLDESLTKFFRMMRVVLLVVCAMTAATVSTYAQNKSLSGTVSDGTGQGLPGVTVAVKGTTLGTITDVDGKFSLSVPATARTLTFSFVGMTTQEIAIGTQTTFRITMKEETRSLEEVVVVGFGTAKKESVVGSIVTATSESLKRSGNPANLAQALTGQLAGVTTITSTGEPGNDDPRILIRAQGTWNNSQPLILVDGVERKMNDIDISEVESISVLKDASATAVFGVKGSEGVILITTKRGMIGKPKLSVEANFTMKQLSKSPNKLNSYDSQMLKNQAIEHELATDNNDWSRIVPMRILNLYRNSPGFDRNSFIPDPNGGFTPFKYREVYPDVDWVKENVKPFGTSNRVNLNVQGGTNFAQYFGSFAYMHDGDILRSGLTTDRPYKSQWGYDRFNFRTNLDFNLTKTTKFSANISGYVGTKKESFSVNNNAGFWNGLYNIGPNVFIPRWDDGYWGTTTIGQIGNPVAGINNSGVETHIRTQVSTDFKLEQNLDIITKGLKASASISYDTQFNTSGGIAEFINGGGGYSRYVDPNIIYMKKGENYMQYVYGSNRSAGLMNFDYVPQPVSYLAEGSGGTGGTNTGVDWWGVPQPAPYRRLYYQGKLDYARKFGKNDIAVTGVVDREELAVGSEFPRYREDWIGRITYNYDGKYFIETNGAYNGSEKFAAKYRFGFFPSVGGSWMLSNEKWLKREWLDKLKLRYTLGWVGDDNFSQRWAYMSNWAVGDAARFGTSPSSSQYTQYYEGSIGNPGLRWETSKKTDYGFEAAVFKNLININFDYFTDDRKDIFMSAGQRSMAPFWGPAPIPANLGKTHTQGYEIELKFQKQIGKANLWLNTAFTHAKDKILYMEDPEGYFPYQKAAGFQIGQTKTSYTAGYLTNWDDVYSTTAYSTNKAYYMPGDLRTVDWNSDGIIDSYDSAPYAYPTRPQNTYNYTLGLDLTSGWSFMVQFYGVNNVSRTMSMWPAFSDGGTYTKVFTATSDDWTPQNLDASWKALRVNNTTTDGTLYLVDASYFRLKTAEVAYQFQNKTFLKKLGISNLRVFVNGNDLILWTKMWDDREDNSGDQFAYPKMKRFNMGLTVNF